MEMNVDNRQNTEDTNYIGLLVLIISVTRNYHTLKCYNTVINVLLHIYNRAECQTITGAHTHTHTHTETAASCLAILVLSLSSLPHSQSLPGSTAKWSDSSLCSESVRGITAAGGRQGGEEEKQREERRRGEEEERRGET